jgi:L-amino acid N-acyltransferase YncA
MQIRPVTPNDADALWSIFHAVVAAGDTYVFAPDTSREDALAYWYGAGIATFVAAEDGRVLGMYKLVANQRDLGSHVGNASFMVAPEAHGKGVGKALGEHCIDEARRRGFRALQFNFVVSTNTAAVALWKKLGFTIVGTLPRAFRHASLGDVDAYVMYRQLDPAEPAPRSGGTS